MVSVRNQRPPSRRLPGGTPCIHELEENVRNNHAFSDKRSDIPIEDEKKRSNHSMEQARDHELEKNRNVLGGRREALVTGIEAFSVPGTKAVAPVPIRARRSPIDQVKPKMISMSSILARSRPAVKVVLEQDLNEMPATDSDDELIPRGVMDLPSIQLQRAAAGLNPAPDFVIQGGDMVLRPAVQLNRAAEDLSDDEDEDSEDDELDQDWVISEGENMHETSGETSDCSLEGRYVTEQLVNELPSVKYVGGRVAFRHKEKSEIMPDCQLVDREMTDAERNVKYIGHPQAEQGPLMRTKRKYRKRGNPNNQKSKVQAEVASPPTASASNGHFLRSSSTVNNDLLIEGDPLRKLPEGSLMHSLYLQVLASGREGISMEDLLTSLHCQSVSAMLADDWEDHVEEYLNHGPYFVQVQGHYRVLSRFLDHSSKISAKGEEKKSSLRSTIGFYQGCGGETGMQPTRRKGKTLQANERGRLFMCNKEPAKRVQGSLLAKQAKIIAEYGVQEGGRRCSLVVSLERKRPRQCPMTAMEDHKLCEYHFKKAEATKKEARLHKKLAKSK